MKKTMDVAIDTIAHDLVGQGGELVVCSLSVPTPRRHVGTRKRCEGGTKLHGTPGPAACFVFSRFNFEEI